MKKVHGPKAKDGRTQKVISRYYDELMAKQPGKSKEYYARVAWHRYCTYKNPDYPGCTRAGKTKALSGPVDEDNTMDVEGMNESKYDFGSMDPQEAFEESIHGLRAARDSAMRLKAPVAQQLINIMNEFERKHGKEFDRGGVDRMPTVPRSKSDLYGILVGVIGGLRSASYGWSDEQDMATGRAKAKLGKWLNIVALISRKVQAIADDVRQWAIQESVDECRADLLEWRGSHGVTRVRDEDIDALRDDLLEGRPGAEAR